MQGGGYESGTRLRANYYEGDDGSKQFVSWFDSQIGVNCQFILAADRQLRCVPFTQVYGFIDATCKTAVAAAATGCVAPTYASFNDTTIQPVAQCTGGPGGTRVYPINNKKLSVGSTYYTSSNGMCTAHVYDQNLANFVDLYEGGVELQPSMFVKAATKTD